MSPATATMHAPPQPARLSDTTKFLLCVAVALALLALFHLALHA